MRWIKGNVVDAEVNFDAEPVVQYIKFLKIYLKLGLSCQALVLKVLHPMDSLEKINFSHMFSD